MLAIATDVLNKAKRSYARTYVSFLLPGMHINQGAWASVLFSPEPKVMIHGLSRADEEQFLAEHKADQRSLLGSWLTSPPAAPGRLTIYSDHGKVFAEWRLRGGQKTVDELRDSNVKGQRRFDVPGGGYYVLVRTGDLELWDKSNLIATAERIRPEYLAQPAAVALITKPTPPQAARVLPQGRDERLVAGVSSQPQPPIQLQSKLAPGPVWDPSRQPASSPPSVIAPSVEAGSRAEQKMAAIADVTPEPGPPELANDPVKSKTKSKKSAKSQARIKVGSVPTQKAETPGDVIAAKMAGRI